PHHGKERFKEPEHSGTSWRCTYFESLRCVYVAEAAEFSVSLGSQSLHNLTPIYATSPNTWDWQVEAFCVDSIARSSRRFSFAHRRIHPHLSRRTANFFCSHSLSTRLSIPARSGK